MQKDILKLIKNTGASRNFETKEIANSLLVKIVEAGRWGLSILGIQPWKIVCIKRNHLIKKIAAVTRNKAKELENPFGTILKLTATTIEGSMALIAVYNNQRILKRTQKYGKLYKRKARVAEIQAIGGAIQNMILEASSLGLGSVWMDSPTFFNEKEINEILQENNELIAILAIGYPSKKINRSVRTEYKDMVRII